MLDAEIAQLLNSDTEYEEFVAATDLFPFANQCPRQAIRPLIDPSRQSAMIPSSSRTIFSSPFW